MNSDKPGGPEYITGGKLTGQKPALKMTEVWAIRTRLEMEGDERSLALFNLAIDSKLRGCDLVRIRVSDVAAGGEVKSRDAIIQEKTGRLVRHALALPRRCFRHDRGPGAQKKQESEDQGRKDQSQEKATTMNEFRE